MPYLNFKEALKEAKDSFSSGSNKDKLASTAKLLGKSVANVGMFALEAGVAVVKNIPEAAGRAAKDKLDKNSHLMTDEQIESANQLIESGEKAKERRIQKEKEDSEVRSRLDAEEWYIMHNREIDARIREKEEQEKEKKIKEREERQRQNMNRKKEQERLDKEKK